MIRNTLIATGLALAAVAAAAAPAAAQVNEVSFQGRLTDSSNNPIASSTSVVFAIYTGPGPGGTPVWTETQSVTPNSNGVFSVRLGAVTSFPAALDWTATNYFLGITVGSDSEMTPRYQFTSAGMALRARRLGGVDATSLSALVTHTTLNTLTAGTSSVADSLHTHATFGQAVTFSSTAGFGGAVTFSAGVALPGSGITGGGSGSGLNADSLDSIDSLAFAQRGIAQTIGGAWTFSGANVFSTAPSFTAAGAPFSVSNSTLVGSLNADQLDSLDQADFLRSNVADAYTSGTMTFNAGTTLSIGGTWQIGVTTVTASAAELNALAGINLTNVTAANLNQLTGGGATALHTHFGNSWVASNNGAPGLAVSNTGTGAGSHGLTGITSDPGSAGVNAQNGNTVAVGANPVGLLGSASHGSGWGVVGSVAGTTAARGVFGRATGVTGAGIGVYGDTASASAGAAGGYFSNTGGGLSVALEVNGILRLGGSNTAASVSGTNLNTLTAGSGSDAQTLHTHGNLASGTHTHVLTAGGTDVSVTAAILNQLTGSSANVTGANLSTLTGGGQTTLHLHDATYVNQAANDVWGNAGAAGTLVLGDSTGGADVISIATGNTFNVIGTWQLNSTTVNATAANLNTLTAGSTSDAQALHTHGNLAGTAHTHVLTAGATDVTVTAAILNQLAGSSANVTGANLSALTGGGQTALHLHDATYVNQAASDVWGTTGLGTLVLGDSTGGADVISIATGNTFNIIGTWQLGSTTVNATAANLNTLTAGIASDAQSLHTHGNLSPTTHNHDAVYLNQGATDTWAVAGASGTLTLGDNVAGTADSVVFGSPITLPSGASMISGGGTGSGLDADLLDGINSTRFLLNDVNASWGNAATTGTLTLGNATGGADTIVIAAGNTLQISGGWMIGATTVSSTGAELNKLNLTSANVTATNLNTLTAGVASDAQGLHTHGNLAGTAHTHVLTAGATDVTVTATILNQLTGSSANVTGANLSTLTGSGSTTLHTHFGNAWSAAGGNAAGLSVTNSASGANDYGVVGIASGTGSAGVRGVGSGAGAAGQRSIGVRGESTGTLAGGATAGGGVYGTAADRANFGVVGEGLATVGAAGNAVGVFGTTQLLAGYGVQGDSQNGRGVYGNATGTLAAGIGVYGQTASTVLGAAGGFFTAPAGGVALEVGTGAFRIGGTNASANVTGTNLSTLTGGAATDAQTLHTHSNLSLGTHSHDATYINQTVSDSWGVSGAAGTLTLGDTTGGSDTISFPNGNTVAFGNTGGTPPFTVATSQLVTNLNAQQLNSLTSGQFLRSDITHQWAVSAAAGTLTLGDSAAGNDTISIPAGNTLSLAGTLTATGTGTWGSAGAGSLTLGNSTGGADTIAIATGNIFNIVTPGDWRLANIAYTGTMANLNTLTNTSNADALHVHSNLGGFAVGSFLRSDAADTWAVTGGGTLTLGAAADTVAIGAAGALTLPTGALSISGAGAGSGLDADFLDGVNGGGYLRSNANDTFTVGNTLTINGVLNIANAGDWRIGGTGFTGTMANLNSLTDGSNVPGLHTHFLGAWSGTNASDGLNINNGGAGDGLDATSSSGVGVRGTTATGTAVRGVTTGATPWCGVFDHQGTTTTTYYAVYGQAMSGQGSNYGGYFEANKAAGSLNTGNLYGTQSVANFSASAGNPNSAWLYGVAGNASALTADTTGNVYGGNFQAFGYSSSAAFSPVYGVYSSATKSGSSTNTSSMYGYYGTVNYAPSAGNGSSLYGIYCDVQGSANANGQLSGGWFQVTGENNLNGIYTAVNKLAASTSTGTTFGAQIYNSFYPNAGNINSTTAYGIYNQTILGSTDATGTIYGIYNYDQAYTGGYGVFSQFYKPASTTGGTVWGAFFNAGVANPGSATSTTTYGVRAEATANGLNATGTLYGVYAYASGYNNTIYGTRFDLFRNSSSTTGTTYGTYFSETFNPLAAATGQWIAHYAYLSLGANHSTDSYAAYFLATGAGTGAHRGVYAYGNNAHGAWLERSGNSTTGSTNAAVYINSTSSTFNGLYVNGFGAVTGSFSKASGTFLIDHPLDPTNKVLRHSFVESPEMMNVYKGRARLVNGEVTITLPEWFDALNHPDTREISLTCINGWSPLFLVDHVRGNQFTVRTADGGSAIQEFSWVVYAVRNDKWARENPVIVEEEKGVGNGFEKGRSVHDGHVPGPRPEPEPEELSPELPAPVSPGQAGTR